MTAVTPLGHARAFELLPWLVNGSLAPAERDAVEQHVRTCITCHRELREQRRLQAAIGAQPTVHVSAQTAFDRLDRQLDDLAAEAPRWRRYETQALPFALATAAGIALLALLVWLVPLPSSPVTPYFTLSTTSASSSSVLDVVFAPGTTEADLRALLESLDAEIVAGPSDLGRYTIRVPTADPAAQSALDALARDARVRLVTPAFSADSP